jgi:hypothetical protein
MSPGRYSLSIERCGPANYFAMLFRGSRMVSSAYAHTPVRALRDVVAHVRHLRRIGWIRKECA